MSLGAVAVATSAVLSIAITSSATSIVGYWQSGASLITPTINATETLLANGLVLVAGGEDFVGGVATPLTTAELYSPTTGTWTATGSLNTPRFNASAVLLNNGNVLIAGGENIVSGVSTPLASAELYNPSSGLWTTTGAIPVPVNTGMFNSTLTLLSSGKALIAGGESINAGVTTTLSTSYVFNPAGTWVATTTNLQTAAYSGTATLLANGDVIMIGGESVSSGVSTALPNLQLYNPATGINGSWSSPSATLPTAAFGATGSLLSNGEVLFAGGETIASGIITPLATAYLYNPSADTLTATGSLTKARYDAGAAVLSSGSVLVAGGIGSDGGSQNVALSSAEIYDPSSGTWSATGSLTDAQSDEILIKLANGNVVVAAGTSSSNAPVSNLETFLTGTAPAITTAAAATFTVGASGSYTVSATGTPTPTFTESGLLPTGVTFTDQGSGSALLSGTPGSTSASSYSFTITAANTTGLSATQSFVLTVNAAPTASTTTTIASTSTTTTVASTTPTTTTVPPAGSSSTATTAAGSSVGGYWLARANGAVFHHGNAMILQSNGHSGVVAISATPDGGGYWTITRSGRISNTGDARFYGSPVHVRRLAPVVSMAVTNDGGGYWVLTSGGSVYAYGDAKPMGSIARQRRLLPAVGIAASPDSKGYWIASRNGIVTGFGSVHTYGASPARHAVVGITASPAGIGYWLTTKAGNVYNFGDAPFYGSLARRRNVPRVTGLTANPAGTGYYLLSDTGFVYPFGAATSFGSTKVGASSPMVGLAVVPSS